MKMFQKEFRLQPYPRGIHEITSKIYDQMPEIMELKQGMIFIFIKHTSASLTINENADSGVLSDMERHFDEMVPENLPYYVHTYEGPDDMPAHIKTSLYGNSLQIPVTHGSLNLGTWQGIFLCEHRNYGGSRSIVISLMGV